MLAFLLMGCAGENAAGADDAGGDSAADTATEAGDTGPDLSGAWTPPEPACELVAPLRVAAGELPYLYELEGPPLITVVSITAEFPSFEGAYGCPASTPGAGGSTLWSGACETDEFSWVGSWVATERDDEHGAVLSHVGSAVRFHDDGAGYAVAFDGYIHYEAVGDVGSIEREFSLATAGFEPSLDGEWTIRGSQRWEGDAWYTMDARVEVVRDIGASGDHCLWLEAYRHPACDEEPWGGWVLQGDATLVVTFDPAVACDGCGDVTLDGVPVGQACGREYGAFVP